MIESLIVKYGYFALAAGVLLEGEMVLVIAGFLSHRGLLEIGWVIPVAIGCTLFADQTTFWIGRRHGMEILRRRPIWQRRSRRVRSMLRRHGNLTAFGFRFVYGVRIVTPLLLGASGYSPLRFLVLNVVGASVWASTFAILGYFFGGAMTRILTQMDRFDEWVLIGIAVIAIVALSIRWWRRRHEPIVEAAAAEPGESSGDGTGITGE